MSFAPYLVFDGTARDAMTHYAEIFGAGDLQITGFDDAPGGASMPGHGGPGDACPGLGRAGGALAGVEFGDGHGKFQRQPDSVSRRSDCGTCG